MKCLSVAFLLMTALTVTAVRADDDAPDPVISNLCSSGVEGSAIGKVGNTDGVRLNFFCLDPGRMAGSVYISVMENPTMTYSTASEGILMLSQFPQTPDEREGISSTTSLAYIKVNIADLQKGLIRGYYVYGGIISPIPIVAQMDQHFQPSRVWSPRRSNTPISSVFMTSSCPTAPVWTTCNCGRTFRPVKEFRFSIC